MIDVNLNPSRNELRLFAVLQILFFGLISFMLWRKGTISPETVWVIVGLSGVLGVAGFVGPKLIRPVYVVWMLAVLPIGWTVSHLVIVIIFYLVITPVALIMKLCGRDPMQRKFDPAAKTYWQPRSTEADTKRYFRQF